MSAMKYVELAAEKPETLTSTNIIGLNTHYA